MVVQSAKDRPKSKGFGPRHIAQSAQNDLGW